ncbi:MAG: LytTR family DNA-binding domain-containing protein [Coprobacillus sp.]
MLNILVCDDDKSVSEEIHSLVNRFFMRKNLEYNIDVVDSGEIAKKNLDTTSYDILFLDIEMGQVTGLEVAKKARTLNVKSFIVFVSHYNEYQKYVFSIHTFDYIMKPFKAEDILKVLEDIYSHMEESESKQVNKELFKIKDGIVQLDVDKIIYFEYKERKVRIVTEDKVYITNVKISDMFHKMEKYFFFMPHKAYVINMNQIQKFHFQEGIITMTNKDKVPLSQLKAKDFKEKYFALTSLVRKNL